MEFRGAVLLLFSNYRLSAQITGRKKSLIQERPKREGGGIWEEKVGANVTTDRFLQGRYFKLRKKSRKKGLYQLEIKKKGFETAVRRV